MSDAEPIKILIDGRMLLGRFSGVARFVTRLVEKLAGRADARVSVLCGNENYGPWRDRTDIELISSSFARSDRSPKKRRRWEARHLDDIIRAAQVDIYHATWNTGVPIAAKTPTVLTVHDLIPWDQPTTTLAGRRERWHYRRAQRYAIRQAALITTVSHYVRRQLTTRWPHCAPIVHTVYNGVDPAVPCHVSSASRRTMESGTTTHKSAFMLYVGGHEARKNVEGLFRAMDAYWKQFNHGLTLKLTGTPETLTPAARQALDGVRFRDQIQFLGKIDDRTLHEAYDSASALLFLSRDEGFGLPALEAMAHGCPVIASRCASLPEVVGDAGLLTSPANPSETASAMHQVLSDPDLRNRLRDRGMARAAAFTWTATADHMFARYRSALGRQSTPPASTEIIKSQARPRSADLDQSDLSGFPSTRGESGPPCRVGHSD